MIKLYVAVAVIAIVSGVLVTGACMTVAEHPEPFLIAWNYDTSGYLQVCGCSAHQLGGLTRRSTKLQSLSANQPVLKIEGAHFVEAGGEFQLFKGETVVRALTAMGYHAVMLGIREAQHGEAGLDRLTALSVAPCFSANLLVDGQPWPVSTAMVDIAGLTVGITGVSQPEAVNFELPEGLGFGDPRDCLDRALAQLGRQPGIIVVCLEGEESWIAGIMRDYAARADLFLTGNRAPGASLEFTVDPPRLNNWDLGKYLGVVAVDPGEDGAIFSGMSVPLEDTQAEDPAIVAILDEHYKAHLKEKFFSRMKADLEQLYLPPTSCQPCHAEAYEAYQSSRHAQALNTLIEVNETYNPDCMACHVVYDPGEDELRPMNCIVCHVNITEQHLWDAVEGNVTLPDPPVASYTYQSCEPCHNELNSLPFLEHWPQYVHRIYHGGDDAEARAAAEELGIDYTAPPPDIASHMP